MLQWVPRLVVLTPLAPLTSRSGWFISSGLCSYFAKATGNWCYSICDLFGCQNGYKFGAGASYMELRFTQSAGLILRSIYHHQWVPVVPEAYVGGYVFTDFHVNIYHSDFYSAPMRV